MREIKRLEGGPLVVGSRSRVTQPKGRPMVWTVTELEPLGEFTWVAAGPGLSFEAVHRIDHAGPDAGEAVTTTLEFIVTGPLAWAGSANGGLPDPLLPRDGEHGPEAGRRAGLALVVTRPTVPRTARPRLEIPGDHCRDLQKFAPRCRGHFVAHIDDAAGP
jgi:hypothetical protein